MTQMLINDFLNSFHKLEGKTVWIIEEKRITKQIREPGGYDHLGCLPDKITMITVGFYYTVKKIIISEFNIDLLIEHQNKIYYTEEDAYWACKLKNQNKERFK